MRVDNAAIRGVDIPQGWKTALRNLDLPDIIKKHLERVRAESKVPGLGCRLLGAPVSVPLADTGHGVGAIVPLNGAEYVLCAHVAGDQWLCHRGSFDATGVLDEQHPLQVKDLVVKDLASAEASNARKRIRTHLLTGQLRRYIVRSPRAFDALVASATIRAPEMRGDHEGQAFQDAALLKQFELSPWRWPERAWDASVYLLWTWHNRGVVRRAISSIRLDQPAGSRAEATLSSRAR